ncbi:RDD family protein [Candidatus Micrarchaeota archaeon]|nr:RDD family protein [Candidatus Micrarchaeota archaeon]
MTQKVFWKSALKASVLMYFVIGMLTTLILILFFSDRIGQMMGMMSADREGFGVTLFLMGSIHIFLIFAWILFAFLYEKIPFKKTILKAFLFNLILVSLELLFFSVFEIKNADVLGEIIFGSDNCCFMFVPLFLITTIMFAYFFDFFRKTEEKETKGKPENKLASIPRRFLAFLIDLIILGIFSALISFFLLLTARYFWLTANIQLSIPAILSLIAFCSTIFQIIYWTVLEGKFGASIGKKLLKIKVVKENGEKIGYTEAFFRNVTKFADNLLLFVPIDALTIFTTKNKQRFFDKLAGTIVIRTGLKKEKLMLESPKAGFIQRFSATLLDIVLLIALMLLSGIVSTIFFILLGVPGDAPELNYIIGFITGHLTFIVYFFLFSPLYWIYFTATKGQTIGKQLKKVKIYTIEGNTPVGWKKAILRYIGYWISLFSLLLGFLWIAFDKNKQGWHDKFADTFAVKEEKKAFNAKKYLLYLIALSIILGVLIGIIISLMEVA